MFRKRFFQLTTLAIIAFTIFGALAQKKIAKKLSNNAASSSLASVSLEEKAFSMQSKLIPVSYTHLTLPTTPYV